MLQPRKKINPNAATRQDSINVKEDSKRLLKEYLDKGYEPTNKPFPNETLDETLNRTRNKTGKTEIIRNNVRNTEKYDTNEFRTDVNENQFRQRESANGVLNMDITPALYDKRIKPVGTINLMGKRSGTYNDGVSIPSYADLEISPETNGMKMEKVLVPKRQNAMKLEKTLVPNEPKVTVATKVVKPVTRTSKYREGVEPQADTLSKQTLGVTKIREDSNRAIKTLNIVQPRKS